MEGSTHPDVLVELHQLLQHRETANKILNKQQKLSLLTTHISKLNRIFATYNPNELTEPHEKEKADVIEYLRNFLTSTPALKLVHGQSTVQGAIDVSRLHCLTVLEIKKVPVHLLVGLRSLRQQLQVLICTRSLNSIKSLISSCGGDQAEEQEWPSLHTLVLTYNHINYLDDSLRLVPALKNLDLSHNNIKQTGDFLECLTELQHLNLSFNSISRIPALSDECHLNLKTMNLRNNNIDSLNGFRRFLYIESLDVSWNCIYSLGVLFAINSAEHISKISIIGNPITFAPGYRVSVIKLFHASAAYRKVFLDGKLVTDKEKKYISGKPMKHETMHPSSDYLLSYTENSIYTLVESVSDYGASSPMTKRKLKTKKKKVRQAPISDLNDPPELLPSTPKKDESDLEEAKQQYEKMRKIHGEDWLLALQDPYKSTDDPIVVQSSSTSAQNSGANAISDGDNAQVRVEVSVDNLGSGKGTESYDFIQDHRDVDDGNTTGTSDGQHSTLVEIVKMEVSIGVAQDIPETEGKSRSNPPIKVEATEDQGYQCDLNDENFDDEQVSGAVFCVGSSTLSKDDTDSIDEMRRHHASLENDLCGPLLVLLQFKPHELPTQMFLTVKETYIEECDLFGNEFDRLELKSLVNLQVTEEEVTFDPDEGRTEIKPVLELFFDYVRIDRRKRRYILEDEDSCLMMTSLLRPFADKSQGKQKKVIMQCLKCTKEFPLEKAELVIVNNSKIKGSGGGLNEVPICPTCKSTLLVEKEITSSQQEGRPISSLSGSTPSSLDEAKPLAASSPWKPRDKELPDGTATHVTNGMVLLEQSEISNETVLNDESYNGGETSNSINPDWDNAANFPPNYSNCSESFMGDLKLPVSTIPHTSVNAKTPIEEVVHYPQEQLDLLLRASNAAFMNRYSLVPPHLINESRRSRPTSENDYLSDLNSPTETPSTLQRNGSEEEFDVLPDSEENRVKDDHPGTVHAKNETSVAVKSGSIAHERLGSNESDIQILNEKESQGVSIQIVSAACNVFESSENYDRKSKRYSHEERESDDASSRSTSLYGSLKESFLNWKTDNKTMEMSNSSEVKKEGSVLQYADENFETVDHRLKLYLTMSVFSEGEELKCIIKTTVCVSITWGNPQYSGLVVVSSHNFYFMRIFADESEVPSEFLTTKSHHALQDLVHIHIGLGSQTLQLEFATEGIVGNLIIGDEDRCERFAKLLEEAVYSSANKPKNKYKGIMRKHKTVQDAITKIRKKVEPDNYKTASNLFVNVTTASSAGASTSLLQGVLCTNSLLILIEENSLWPLAHVKTSKLPKGKQFVMKECAKVTEVTEVKISREKPYRAVVCFLHEEDDKESEWDLKVSTLYSFNQLLAAINKPWTELFGIELTMTSLDDEA